MTSSLKGSAVRPFEDKCECNSPVEEFVKKLSMIANLEGSSLWSVEIANRVSFFSNSRRNNFSHEFVVVG